MLGFRGLKRWGLGFNGSSGFNPLSIFSGGAAGAWYDPSDISTLFQDTAAATPVTATGQPVGRINDKSGNGHHLLQATAGLRPTYTDDASGKYLLLDGVDDYMRVATPALAQPWDRISAIRQVSWTSLDYIYSAGNGVLTANLAQFGVTPAMVFDDGAGAAVSNNGLAIGTSGVVTESHNGASSRMAINNAAYVTGNAGATASAGLTLGWRADNTQGPANIRFYGLLHRAGTLSDAEIAKIRTWLGAKVGLVL